MGCKPVEESDRGPNLLADDDVLGVRSLTAEGAVPQPPQQVPDGVAVQQVLLVGVGAVGDGAGDPPFEPDHVLVARRQDSGRDQDAAQVLDRLAGGQVVEDLVGEGALGDVTQDLGCGALGKPSGQGGGSFDRGEGVVERLAVRRNVPGIVCQQFVQPLLDVAPSTSSFVEPSPLSVGGATVAEDGVGAGAQRTQRARRRCRRAAVRPRRS